MNDFDYVEVVVEDEDLYVDFSRQGDHATTILETDGEAGDDEIRNMVANHLQLSHGRGVEIVRMY